jgi:hypothetical protein
LGFCWRRCWGGSRGGGGIFVLDCWSCERQPQVRAVEFEFERHSVAATLLNDRGCTGAGVHYRDWDLLIPFSCRFHYNRYVKVRRRSVVRFLICFLLLQRLPNH